MRERQNTRRGQPLSCLRSSHPSPRGGKQSTRQKPDAAAELEKRVLEGKDGGGGSRGPKAAAWERFSSAKWPLVPLDGHLGGSLSGRPALAKATCATTTAGLGAPGSRPEGQSVQAVGWRRKPGSLQSLASRRTARPRVAMPLPGPPSPSPAAGDAPRARAQASATGINSRAVCACLFLSLEVAHFHFLLPFGSSAGSVSACAGGGCVPARARARRLPADAPPARGEGARGCAGPRRLASGARWPSCPVPSRSLRAGFDRLQFSPARGSFGPSGTPARVTLGDGAWGGGCGADRRQGRPSSLGPCAGVPPPPSPTSLTFHVLKKKIAIRP